MITMLVYIKFRGFTMFDWNRKMFSQTKTSNPETVESLILVNLNFLND